MPNTRRAFIQSSILAGGSAALLSTNGIAEPLTAESSTEREAMSAKMTATVPAGTSNVLGGNHFDPTKWLIVPARTFKDLKVGDVYRAPSRTLTDAHTSEFQAVSTDTHPRHYNADYAKSHGLPAALVQPFQLLSMTAPGATLFTHYVGESIVSLSEVSCKFEQTAYVGDTMYPALEIAELSTNGDKGLVTMAIVTYNQKGQVVLSGQQRFVLKLS